MSRRDNGNVSDTPITKIFLRRVSLTRATSKLRLTDDSFHPFIMLNLLKISTCVSYASVRSFLKVHDGLCSASSISRAAYLNGGRSLAIHISLSPFISLFFSLACSFPLLDEMPIGAPGNT